MRYEWAKGDVIVETQPGAPGVAREVARAARSLWSEKAELTIDGSAYTFSRDGWRQRVAGELGGEQVMTAEPRGWRRVWQVTTPSGSYVATPTGFWQSRLAVTRDGVEIGRLLKAGSWSNRAALETAGPLDSPTVAFLLWIAHVHWQRQVQTAAST